MQDLYHQPNHGVLECHTLMYLGLFLKGIFVQMQLCFTFFLPGYFKV